MTWCPATRASHSGWTGDTAATAIGSPLPKVKLGKQHPPKKVKHNYRPRGMFKADPGQPALGSSVSSFYLGVGHSFDLFLICILISSCRTGLWKEPRRRVGGVSWECVCGPQKCEPLLGATGLKMHIGVRRNLCVFFLLLVLSWFFSLV